MSPKVVILHIERDDRGGPQRRAVTDSLQNLESDLTAIKKGQRN